MALGSVEFVLISAVIKQIASSAGALTTEEVFCLWWFTENVKWLEHQMELMHGYLQDAEDRQAGSEVVRTLLKNIRELRWDTEDVFDKFLPKIESYRSRRSYIMKTIYIIPHAYRCTILNCEIIKIIKRVEGIDQDRKTYGIEDKSVPQDHEPSEDPRTNTVYSDESIVVGFDGKIEELKNMLLRRENSEQVENHSILPIGNKIVSIVGMSGVGKTTLAKKVFECIKIDESFDCHAKVSISQQPNVKDILKKVAKQVGLANDKTEENLEQNLCEYLKRKRYALFLDDIWETTHWDKLSECFPKNNNAIIITSQNAEVGGYICGSERALHRLTPFDPKSTHSWNLFSQLIDPLSEGFINPELEHIGRKIVRRCGNLPLAIKVTAGILRGKGQSARAWQEVLNSMDNQDPDDQCLQCLKLSYKNLPTNLKPCFLCFGMFPNAYKIRSAEVIRIWMAENLIESSENREAEDVGANHLDMLCARNLIQVVDRTNDERIKSFTIHDHLHSLCVNLAKESTFFHTSIQQREGQRLRRLGMHQWVDDENNRDAHATELPTELRSLLIYGSSNLNCKLGTFSFLKLLRLELYTDLQSPVTDGMGNLRHLKCMHLYAGEVSIRGCVCNMKKLQALEVRGLVKTELPICIWKMEQLQHLLLSNTLSLTFVNSCTKKSSIKVSLPSLQTLEMPRYVTKKEFLVTKAFPNLRKLKMNYSEFARQVITNVKNLPVDGHFTPNLIKLTLQFTQLDEYHIETLKKLPRLKILKLGLLSYSGSKIDCSGIGSFPCLEVLHLQLLRELTEVIRECEDDRTMGMPNLKKLIVEYCPRLINIPASLEQKLIVVKCPKLKKFPASL